MFTLRSLENAMCVFASHHTFASLPSMCQTQCAKVPKKQSDLIGVYRPFRSTRTRSVFLSPVCCFTATREMMILCISVQRPNGTDWKPKCPRTCECCSAARIVLCPCIVGSLSTNYSNWLNKRECCEQFAITKMEQLKAVPTPNCSQMEF